MLTFSNFNVIMFLVIYMKKVEIIATTAERLNEAMKLRNIKQAEVSRLSGIDKSSISLYLKGKYAPKGDKLYRLATVLGVSPVWLSGFNVPRNEDNQKQEYNIPDGFMPVPKTVKKPRLGVISCGVPIDNPENFDG